MRRFTRIVVAAVALCGALGCSSRMPILDPDPRTPEEYAADRDVCLRKHTFGVVGATPGPCLHCELFALCMEQRMWRSDGSASPDPALPCCRGTATSTS